MLFQEQRDSTNCILRSFYRAKIISRTGHQKVGADGNENLVIYFM